MIQSFSTLEQFLQQNNMKSTLQNLRAQLLSKIPTKPSKQFLSLFQKQQPEEKLIQQGPRIRQQNPEKNSLFKKNKKAQLPVQGLLGKLAYSSLLLKNKQMGKKLQNLMNNKLLNDSMKTLFPQASSQPQYLDQLQLIEPPLSQSSFSLTHANQISSIDFQPIQTDNSILSQQSQILQEMYKIDLDQQYQDDRDLGYYQEVFDQQSLMEGCQQLTMKYHYPHSAIRKERKHKDTKQDYHKFKQIIQHAQKAKFPKGMLFPSDQDPTYPIQYNGVSYDVMNLKVIYDRQRIGYEPIKNIQYKKGDIIAGVYEVDKILGSGVFATVIRVKNLSSDNQEMTCFKMIQNDKDFMDQALDELKILRYIKANCNPNDHYLLNIKQMFYHRQHLFIETDLLKDNLLTAFQTSPSFFSIPMIRLISQQILEALRTLHSLSIIHADLKPQNIMIKSYSPLQIRVIDLGNGTYIHDMNLSSYVQSRSYRAPEVLLGCGFNQGIDVWSLGCIVAELWTKNVLFFNYHVQGMLARIQGIVGPWPEWMLQNGENVPNFFSNQNFIFQHDKEKQIYHILIPKKTSLNNRIRSDDQLFIDFIRMLVEIDPLKRPSAAKALQHPFLRV